jgi:hypothetical protein
MCQSFVQQGLTCEMTDIWGVGHRREPLSVVPSGAVAVAVALSSLITFLSFVEVLSGG